MSSVIVFIIIALLIKKGLSDSHGFSDIGKILGTVAAIAFVVSLFANPLILVLLGVGVIAGVIALVNKLSGTQHSEISRAHTEEFQQMYQEVYEMELKKFKSQHGADYERANMTEKRARDLEDERKARESAARFVNEQVRKKYGDAAANAVATGTAAADSLINQVNQNGPSNGYSARVTNDGKVYVQTPGNSSAKKKNTANIIKSKILPKAQGRRSKIVNKFNEQYNLYLTDEQVGRIVAASYMSNAWKQEVEAMYTKYDSVYQWLVGDTAYLRAYLRAFPVQEVSSDFDQQIKIVTDSFEEIFEYSDSIAGISLERRIEMINSKFLTNFDDITYMIAYRYLESLGFHHELEKTQLNRIDGTFDDLVAKYDKMSTEEVDEALSQVAGVSAGSAGSGGGEK
ncbi:MAG: hypothetical protein K6G12_03720 [Lachnospiraceae bacterium]|nr:hypothetical protein [Lachnospiraceae bacterium]